MSFDAVLSIEKTNGNNLNVISKKDMGHANNGVLSGGRKGGTF